MTENYQILFLIRGLIAEIKDILDPINKTLCNAKKINKNEIESLENILKKHVNKITKSIRQIASNLIYD